MPDTPEFEVVADGFRIPEGPVILSDGSLLIGEVGGGLLWRIWPDGRKEVVCETGGGTNGLAIGPGGKVFVCNNGGTYRTEIVDGLAQTRSDESWYVGGSIQVVDLETGALSTLYRDCHGVPLEGPNDLVFDAHGGFWFSDMGRVVTGGHRFGGIYYAKPDGSEIRRVREGTLSTNGIGLSPDGGTLYWADTFTGRLWRARVTAPGELEPAAPMMPGEVVCTLPGLQALDSLAVEAGGKVCVGTIVNGGITVFDPADGSHEHVPVPDGMVTNICFGGEDMQTAWLTAAETGRVLKTRWPRPGLRLTYNA